MNSSVSTYRRPPATPGALFEPHERGVVASELTRGPWAHRVMHGGPICGLLGWAVEQELGRDDLVCTRLAVDIVSGIPVEQLDVTARVVKPGRRTAIVEATIAQGDRLLARASSQWLADDGAAPPAVDATLPTRPDVRADPGSHPDMEYPRPGFNADGVDLRILEGSTEESGPGRIWIRLDHQLVADTPTTPFQAITTLSDLGAAVGWEESPSGGALINTDVTLQLLRRPVGEWFLFESHIVHGVGGLACCRSDISDERGRLGWVLQSQMEAPESIATTVFASGENT